jgi:predicted nucleic acid-binding protein
MRLVDTSAWIETLIGSPLGQIIAAELPIEADWLMPTIVQHEIAKWLRREGTEDLLRSVIAFSMTCRVAPLDTEIALAAAELTQSLKLASADAVVLATAQRHQAELLTCDANFDGLPGIRYYSKRH